MASNKKGITVRFEDDEMAALEALAKKYKVTSATIIRWALTALDDYVQANGGRVVLPLDFDEFLKKSEKEASPSGPLIANKRAGKGDRIARGQSGRVSPH